MKDPSVYGIPETEFSRYLKEFRSSKYFAAIKAGGDCLDSLLVDSFRTLYELELLPIVVHGAGPQIDRALEKRGIVTIKINGKRVTDEQTRDVVIETIKKLNNDFISEINSNGEYAEGLNGVFHVDGTDSVLGYVGNVIGMDRDAVEACLGRKRIPVLSSYGADADRILYNPNADSSYRFMVSQFKPDKCIILSNIGGYIDGKLVRDIKNQELEGILASGNAGGGMQVKLAEAKTLSDMGFSVQIASPKDLIAELFSDKGSGTFIHKA
jgi:acetylglutamate kinase